LTLHATVCVDAPGQVTAVLGAVTAKGPEPPPPPFTTTVVEALFVPNLLSRTVTRKCSVRAVVGRHSKLKAAVAQLGPVGGFKTLDSFGNIRIGDTGVSGSNERKIARLPLSVLGGACVPWSSCSQV